MNEEKPPPPVPPAPAPKAKANPVVLIGVIVGALVVGAAAGGLLIGPRLVAGKASPAAHGEPTAKEAEPAQGKNEKEPGRTPVFRIENVIVNPSGSQGAHFLMVTIAVEVPSDKMEAKLREHDAEIRDMVITILERMTLDDLGQPGTRDRIKRAILTGLTPLTGKSSVVRIFLPQFVVQ